MSTNENQCPVNQTKLALKQFYTDESKNGMCSKCHPCKLGVYDAIQILDTIQAGKGEKRHVSHPQADCPGREGRQHVQKGEGPRGHPA